MNNKQLAVISVALMALLSVVAIVAFQYGTTYRRNASLGIDVGTHSFHVTVYIQRVGDAEPTYWSHHAGQLTTIGKNWIEDQLGDSPSTDPAKWISLSMNDTSPTGHPEWTEIIDEIVDGNGLARAAGTYANVGDGVWTISLQFTASATYTDVQLCGFQWAVSGDNNLLWADTFTPVTLNSGDKLTVTGTTTVS